MKTPWARSPRARINGKPATVELKMPFVVFATPTVDYRLSVEFWLSSLETRRLLIERSIPHSYFAIPGDRYLENVRNKLATRFLREFPEATDLFFLDEDVGYPAEKIVEFILRPEPVLAGVYPQEGDELDFPVTLLADKDTGQMIERGGLLRADNVGAGFLRVKRHVLEKLAKVNGRYRETPEGEEIINFFSAGMGENGLFWREDYVFVQKCASLGIETWVDPNIDFSHRGTKAWRANLGEHLLAFSERALEAAADPHGARFVDTDPRAAENETPHQANAAAAPEGIPAGEAA